MADGRSFREVTVPSFQKQGKLIDFTIGSTLTLTVKDEEHGKPHVGGGYAYKESGNLDSPTRNRFIFWFVDKKTLIWIFPLLLSFMICSLCVMNTQISNQL